MKENMLERFGYLYKESAGSSPPVELEGQLDQEIVLAVMTSGMRQKGARYNPCPSPC
jgi:hypothetical protein